MTLLVTPPKIIFALQLFDEGIWKTVFVSTYRADVDDTFDEASAVFSGPARVVSFSVDGLDFLPTYCTNFAVLADKA